MHWMHKGMSLFFKTFLQNQNALSESTSLIGNVLPIFFNVRGPKNITFSLLLASPLLSGRTADNQHAYLVPYLWLQCNVWQGKSRNLEVCGWRKEDIHSQIETKVSDVNNKKVHIASSLFPQARDSLSDMLCQTLISEYHPAEIKIAFGC